MKCIFFWTQLGKLLNTSMSLKANNNTTGVATKGKKKNYTRSICRIGNVFSFQYAGLGNAESSAAIRNQSRTDSSKLI